MGLNAPKSALAEIVGGRQAEVLYPEKIVPAVFGNTVKQCLFKGCSVAAWISFVFLPAVFKVFIYLAMELVNVGFDERFFSPGYGIIAVLDGPADMFLQIIGPLMTSIIRIFLTVTLKMLVTKN